MLFVVCCLLIVVCCLLFVVCCLFLGGGPWLIGNQTGFSERGLRMNSRMRCERKTCCCFFCYGAKHAAKLRITCETLPVDLRINCE